MPFTQNNSGNPYLKILPNFFIADAPMKKNPKFIGRENRPWVRGLTPKVSILFICLTHGTNIIWHLIRPRAVTIFFLSKDLFYFIRAHHMLSYHLILKVPWSHQSNCTEFRHIFPARKSEEETSWYLGSRKKVIFLVVRPLRP